MSDQATQLTDRCHEIHAAAGEAIDWVEEVRADSPRLDRNSDGLIDKLRRVRNLSHRLGRAASRPVSVGFFGLSQAGKSYLISAMAANQHGELETELDGERLNFITHVNPPGGGKEATGLVTRFTRRPGDAPAGYPLEMSIFSEADLVKVLGNAFFNDFDIQQVEFDTSPAHIRQLLSGLQRKRNSQPIGGIDEDGVVELLEYFEARYPKFTDRLKGDYWPTAIALAPHLAAADRAELFSVLWGGIHDLTETFLTLRDALETVGFADTLYCPVSALVVRDAAGEWTQNDSIMNVDILERFGRDQDDRLEVVPSRDGVQAQPVELPRSLLAALTAELKFVLADQPRVALLESVDLLDFPGYRGRLAVANLADIRRQLKDEQVDPVAQLLLRGKVAFLFERYTDDQEMNLLTLCAPSNKQSDVKDLGPVLTAWINSTQGDSAELRGRRQPGLVWALTIFDSRLEPKPGQTEDVIRKSWEGMMKMVLLERFGGYDWVHEWSPGHAFDNLFLVRKPRMAASVIETDSQGEHRILPKQADWLAMLRRTFCAETTVKRHVAEPETAWDAMLSLNDGGVTRLAEYLARVARPELKLARIQEQLDAIAIELVNNRFGAYYQSEGAAEVGNKERIAADVTAALRQRPNRFGDLLAALQPSAEQLRALYLRSDEAEAGAEPRSGPGSEQTPEQATPVAPSVSAPGADLINGLDEILGPANDAPEQVAPARDGASRFVRGTLRQWFAQLQALPEDPHWQAWLGAPKEVLEQMVRELITAADRLGVEEQLIDRIQGAEAQTAAKRARLAERQAYAVGAQLARYVDYLGFDQVALDDRPRSLADPGRAIFAPPPAVTGEQMPVLADKPAPFSAWYIVDWFEAFKSLAINNAGYAAGRDISAEQNARLGRILQRIDAGPDAV